MVGVVPAGVRTHVVTTTVYAIGGVQTLIYCTHIFLVYFYCAYILMRVTHMHGSSVSAVRKSSSLCHLTFSLLMFHPSLLLLFLDGHFETTPDHDLTDFDVHDFLPNFPDLNELFGHLAKSSLKTRRRPNKWIWVESDIENVHMMTCSVRHLKRKLLHLQKIMGVIDVQVLDKDGFKSRSNTIKAKSKIVKERIWTLDAHFANKIVTEQI